MKRLVNDVGRQVACRQGTGARAQFEQYLKGQMSKPSVSDTFRSAVLSVNASQGLLDLYLAERTRASFQGSSDLKVRVRNTLGIANSAVPDADLESLDEFFIARNKIAHEMDLVDPASGSMGRVHRTPDDVADKCSQVFAVGAALVRGAAEAVKAAGV